MTAQTLAAVLAVVLLVGAVTVWLSWKAGRLDRLHIRLTAAHASLERQLADRTARSLAVAAAGVLDPASSLVLLSAAEETRPISEPGGRASQSALSQTLRAVFGNERAVGALWDDCDIGARALLTDLASACDRVRLARGFHDDLVVRTERLRRQAVVGWLHLSGHAPWPRPVSLDDSPPPALVAASARGTGSRR